mmetsp:Transcript_4526/g.6792  ORF Transcript_4526/g.6792 Transcript_4526/m.6792 type:complete len:274 (+) Transcript_4526:38-859(+)
MSNKTPSDHLRESLSGAKKTKGRPAFVAFTTCGFPSLDATVPILLGLQEGGADVIEVGIPFSDPIADGPTIQKSSFIALSKGTTIDKCFEKVKEARQAGLHVPVILMGYYNPMLRLGERNAVKKAFECGANGFIVVDLPPCGQESLSFKKHCDHFGMSFVPLISPATSTSRIKAITATANAFVYCVAVTGVTGKRSEIPTYLKEYIARVRSTTDMPIGVGFGISDHQQFSAVGEIADAVVVGSAIIKAISADLEHPEKAAKQFALMMTTGKSD